MDFLKKKMKELLDDDKKPEKKPEGNCAVCRLGL
jgi:CRISPR/Cas system-associated exonuclease Cas4 (RecB family)